MTVGVVAQFLCTASQIAYSSIKSNETTQMRKIESQMVAAVQGNRNWTSANTSVIFDAETGDSKVYLHGNHIATVTEDSLEIFDGGYQSATTKSRLNALCSAFCLAGEGVFQKDWTWYVRRFVGALGAQSCWKTEEFSNGYVFA